jgi:hypothetical protein
MSVRMRVENPSPPSGEMSMARHRPWNKGRRFRKIGPKRKGGRRRYLSNPHHRHHRRRHHRRNPDMGMLWKIGLGAGAGILASVAGAMALDALWTTGSAQAKTWALVGMAGLAAVFIGPSNPVLAAGIATGMVLVPGQQLIAGFMTSGAPAAPAATGALYGSPAYAGLGAMGDAGTMAALHDSTEAAVAASDDALLRSKGLL